MKRQVNILNESDDNLQDDARPEYHFDYSQARPNHFASYSSEQATQEQTTILLEPDIAAVFTTSEQVNKVLRLLIQAISARDRA